MNVQKLKEKRGITLVVLVVTIVILLILSGVSIRTLSGESGLITKTKIAKEENQKAKYKESLLLAKTEAIAEKGGQEITLDEYIEQIKADKIEGIKSIEKIINDKASVITKEGYIFIITLNTIEYYDNESTLPEINIKDANIEFTFNKNAWTNESVEVTVSKKESKYTLQLSKDTTQWITTSKMVFEENGEIYARLIDQIGRASDIASRKISIIDTEKPNEFTPETTSTTNSITVKAITTDKAETLKSGSSGIDGYRFSKDGGQSWSEYQASGTYEFNNMLKDINGSTYDIVVQAKDKAQNVTTSKIVPATTSKNMKYYVTGENKLLCTISDKNGNITRTFSKYKEDGAIAAIAYTEMYGDPYGTSYGKYVWFHPIIVSTTEDGAKYYGDTPDVWYNGSKEDVNEIEYNGTKYYYSGMIGWVVLKSDVFYDYETSLITINESTNPYNGEENSKEAALGLIKKYLSE